VSERARPLTILWVASELEARGGVGRVLEQGARALAARDHAVHVAGPAAEPPGGFAGVGVHVWRERSPKLARLVDLVPLVRRLRPDVVHFHSAMPHGELIAALRLLRRGGRPLLVATPHSSRPYAKRRAQLGLRAADRVVVASAWAAEHARAAGARRVDVVPAGVELGAEPDPGARDDAVLALGRLAETKGLDVLLDAFEQAARERPAWQLWIAGEGASRDALVGRARALAVRDRVRFLGWLEGDAKQSVLARAAIGVLPSRRESFGGALLEMLAAGLACVASDTGGAAEVAGGGRAALLVPPGDAAALAAALGTLMDDRGARLALARAGRDHARGFDWDAIAARLEAIYREPAAA
jgi:glycosyltransferase involved in cell wall biosynthesis